MGILLYETDKTTEAINAFRNAIDINKEDYRYHYNLALALEKANEKNMFSQDYIENMISENNPDVKFNDIQALII